MGARHLDKALKHLDLVVALAVLVIVGAGFLYHIRLQLQENPKWRSFDLVARIENLVLDLKYLVRGPQSPSGRVGIVAIDEKSIERFGRWPFRRNIYPQILQNLKNAGVRWIALDVLFSESEEPTFREIWQHLEGDWEKSTKEDIANRVETLSGDQLLADAMASFERVIQGFSTLEASHSTPRTGQQQANYESHKLTNVVGRSRPLRESSPYFLINDVEFLINIDSIALSTPYSGFINNNAKDTDGVVRSASVVRGFATIDGFYAEPQFFPSLALTTAAAVLDREIVIHTDYLGIRALQLVAPDNPDDSMAVSLLAGRPGDFLVNHYGPSGSFPRFSLADAFDNLLPNSMPEVVLVGSWSAGIGDLHATPFSRATPGVEIHATIVDNLLSGRTLQRKEWFIAIDAIALVLIWAITVLSKKLLSPVFGTLLPVIIIVSVIAIDIMALFPNGYWFYSGTFLAVSTGTLVSMLAVRYILGDREKRRLRSAFQHYLSPVLVQQALEHPENLKLGGEKRDLTVLFSDIRGFTSLSEMLDPQILTGILNEYFTPMSRIIIESNALLDKYIGDAIMAVWGAPVELVDQGDLCVQACVDMVSALFELRQRWGARGLPLLDIGIGVNSGSMTVGNMGGAQRFDYTVIGDNVNLASRIEGLNKEYGSRILISEATWNRVRSKDKFMVRELDRIVVKGKSAPITIFDVIVPVEMKANEIYQLIERFRWAREHYLNRNFVEAENGFSDIYKAFPKDTCSKTLMWRSRFFSKHSPPDDWDGSWEMDSK